MSGFVKALGHFVMGLLVVALALGVPYLGLELLERVFAITITGLFKALALLAAMFFILVSLEKTSA